ncbi:MAG: DUF4337 domain-containing protein [Novosphingobium sp.]|nr:DUF4337 domain-containing protein [Novosphingobium sp.]
MEIEVSAEAKDKRINRMVAITVVILSVFMTVCHIKDEKVVQHMEHAESDSIDRWNQYQATKTKQHLLETARTELAVLGSVANPATAASVARFDADIAKYKGEAPRLADEARGLTARHDELNLHDDQFDASEALVTAAVSLAAIAALVENFGLLVACWVLGAFGMFFGFCGLLGLNFHPEVLANLLG